MRLPQFGLRKLFVVVTAVAALIGSEGYRTQRIDPAGTSWTNWSLLWVTIAMIYVLLACLAMPMRFKDLERQPNQILLGALLIMPSLSSLLCLFAWSPFLHLIDAPYWARDLGMCAIPPLVTSVCYTGALEYMARVSRRPE